MKRVIVCYKWVLDGADIRVDKNTRKLDVEKAKWTLNEFDRNAIEAGVRVKAATGCELIGITAGVDTGESGKNVLSRGLDAVHLLSDPLMEGADSRTTSKVLAGMIDKLGGADLVICSEASDDEYAQQTSARLAALLGYASVTYVQSIDVAGDQLRLSRKLEDGTEDVEVAEATVISVVPDINDPPIPSLKQILGAKKKPSTAVTLAELGVSEDSGAQLRTESVLAPEVARRRIQLTAGGVGIADAVAKLVHHLSSDGIL